jgi:hypothetical protein
MRGKKEERIDELLFFLQFFSAGLFAAGYGQQPE